MAKVALGFIYKTLLYSLAVVLVLLALVVSGLRYLLPQLPDLTTQVEAFLTERYAINVEVAQISADWSRTGPELVLHELVIKPNPEQATQVAIDQARVHINFWGSAGSASVQFERVQLHGMRIHYDLRDRYSQTASAALEIPDNLGQLLLNQLDHIDVVDSSIELVNLLGLTRAIDIKELRWLNRGSRHQGVGKLAFSEVSDNTLDVIVDMDGLTFSELSGQVYVAANGLNITPWVQQQVIDTEIKNVEFNYKLWLNFKDNSFSRGLLQLGEQRLVWQVNGRDHQLRIPHGELQLRPYQDGWRVNSNPITIEHNQQSWQLPTLSWQQTPTAMALSMDDMPLPPLLELLNLFGSQGAAVSAELANRDTQGVIDIAFAQQLDQPMRWYANGENLSWGHLGGIPGLSNVNLKLQGRGRELFWQLDGVDAAFQSAALDYDEPWPIEKLALSGQGSWQSSDDWQLTIAPTSEVHLPGFPIGLAARLSPAGESINVAATAQSLNAEPIDAEVLRAHLPVIMGEKLHDYLSVALQEGQAEDLAMVWRGPLNAFPYHENAGLFEARARIKQLSYQFQPNWRPLYDASAVVNFRNERMHITAEQAQLGNVQLPRVDVVIPDILAGQQSYLAISADIAGNANELKPIFDDSPLANSLGQTLAELQLDGPLTSHLELTIPLAGEAPQVVAEGYADLDNNRLFVRSLGETFTGVHGRVTFRNEQIAADKLNLSWYDLPLEATLSGAQREQDYYVELDAQGKWPLTNFEPLVAGELPWQADFQLSLPRAGGYSFRWQQTADLTNTAVNAPLPLAKPLDQAQQLVLQVSGSQESILVNAETGDVAMLELQLDGTGETLQSGYARIGEAFTQAANPNVLRLSPNFTLDVNLPAADVEAWLTSYQQLQGLLPAQAGDSKLASILRPDLIQLVSPQLRYSDKTLDDVAMVVWPTDVGWQARLESEQALTDIQWLTHEQRQQLHFEADYIHLAAPTLEPAEIVEKLQVPSSFSGMPDVVLICERCHYGIYDLGKVTLRMQASADQLELTEFSSQQRNHDLTATGRWQLARADSPALTQVQGQLSSPDFGEFLEDYEITSMVRDSDASFDFDLSYAGAPYEFSAESLNGSLNWRLGQGYLNEVSDRGARLFSLLSLDSILRKLQFDFRDVFANGLFYTDFTGDFTIEDGIVRTDNTQLAGAAGNMEVKGYANLVSRAINYDLQFAPKVTSSLPVILAWMINPPSGLAALVLDRVLQDAKVISRLEYKVSGSMDDPIIEEVARDSRAAPIPAEVPDDSQAPTSSTNGAADDQQPEPERQPTTN